MLTLVKITRQWKSALWKVAREAEEVNGGSTSRSSSFTRVPTYKLRYNLRLAIKGTSASGMRMLGSMFCYHY